MHTYGLWGSLASVYYGKSKGELSYDDCRWGWMGLGAAARKNNL